MWGVALISIAPFSPNEAQLEITVPPSEPNKLNVYLTESAVPSFVSAATRSSLSSQLMNIISSQRIPKEEEVFDVFHNV